MMPAFEGWRYGMGESGCQRCEACDRLHIFEQQTKWNEIALKYDLPAEK